MFVFVLNKENKPLMPTNPTKARILLKYNKAKVIIKLPFTIKLTYDSPNYVQITTGGMDTGTKVVGCSVIANSKVLYQSEVTLRQDVSSKMEQRQMYRRNRRSRKTRYRECRFDNRANSRREGSLAPSLKSKLESHIREKSFVESILPVVHWKVELASFDIHKITNPEVSGKGYQEGKRSTGYFSISDIFGNSISDSVNVKKFCKRLLARTTTLIQVQEILPSAFLHEAEDFVVSCRSPYE
jgi:hypothetical protein